MIRSESPTKQTRLTPAPAAPLRAAFVIPASAPTPWYLWVVALILSAGAAHQLSDLTGGMTLLAGGTLLGIAAFIIARPLNGFLLSLCFFPFYTFLRGVAMVYEAPLSYTLLGIWPEIVLCLMTISVVCGCIRTGRRLKLKTVDLPVVIMLFGSLYALLLTIQQQEWSAALYGTHISITGFLFYFVARWLEISERDLKLVLKIWLVSFVLLALPSFWDYFFRPAFLIETAIRLRPDFWKNWEPHLFFRWYPRMQSLLYAEQLWGTLCAFVAIYLAARWGQRKSAGENRWILPLYLLAVLGLALSMSRGAMMCYVTAFTVLLCIPGRHRGLLIVTLLAVVATLGFLIAFYGDSAIVHPLVERTVALADTNNQLAYDRAGQWQAALDAFPLFPSGRGLGRAGLAATFHNTGDAFASVPDGGYFKILAECGVPGLLMFLGGAALWLAALATHVRSLRVPAPGEYALGLAMLCIFCGLLVQNIGGNLFDAYFATPLFFILTGLSVARREKREADALQRMRPPAYSRIASGKTGVAKDNARSFRR